MSRAVIWTSLGGSPVRTFVAASAGVVCPAGVVPSPSGTGVLYAAVMREADVVALRALRGARDRIDRDYGEEIGIAALAFRAGYSREHFIRAFRAAYGETPGKYRTRRRIERACELLRSANLTVTEICHVVGFTSLGTFSARFAEQVGMSPTRYREEAARRGGPAPIPGCFALMWQTGLPAPARHLTSQEAARPGEAVASQA